MARISGVNLPKEKRILIALMAITGIGRSTSTDILKRLNIDENIKVKDLSEADENKIREEIKRMSDKNEIILEGDLRRQVAMNIKRLQEVGCYRGFRHRKGLPVHGQRTQVNGRTRKGKKKTVAGKKMVTK